MGHLTRHHAHRELSDLSPLASQQELLELLEKERLLREVTAAQRDRLARRLQAVQSELADARHQLEEAVIAGANARRELDSLWGSNSWRYTRPLREAGLVVRAVLRRGRALLGGSTPAAPGSEREVATTRMLSSDAARVFDDLRQAVADIRRD